MSLPRRPALVLAYLFVCIVSFAANVAPELLSAFADVDLARGASSQPIALAPRFRDPDVPGSAVRVNVRIGSQNRVIHLAMLDAQAPNTVANFLAYVDAGRYAANILHRSIPGFVLQSGGFYFVNDSTFDYVATFPAVKNEFGVSNTRGTVAMAKLGNDPDSATSQWFINLADNSANLDAQNGGFTVFARVIGDGMAVADEIAALNRYNASSVASAWTDIPLTQASLARQYFVETSISRAAPLAFSVSSDDPALVSATLVDGALVLAAAADRSGATTVRVTATDLEGAATTASFRVGVTPVIDRPPAALSAYLGSSVEFSVLSAGTALTYQWFKDDLALLDDDRVHGTGGPVLGIAAVTPEDAASYAVVVTNHNKIACWGDSMTAGMTPDLVSLMGGFQIYGGGVGGESSYSIRSRMLAAPEKFAFTASIWAGRVNYADTAGVEADVDAMVSALNHSRYIVVSVMNGDRPGEKIGESEYGKILLLNADLQNKYGPRFIDLRGWLIREGLAQAGLAPSAQDVTDIANDIVPSSLRSDAIHLNAAGNKVVASKLRQELLRIVRLDTTRTAISAPAKLTTGKAPQTITFPAPSGKTTVSPAFVLSATASSGLPVSFELVSGPAALGIDGATITLTGATGTVLLRATQPGGVAGGIVYAAAASVEVAFEVAPGFTPQSQNIDFPQPADRVYGDAPVTLSATASSGLPVAFALVSGPGSLNGNVLAITGAGQIVIRATQAGDSAFLAAPDTTRTITVAKAGQSIVFDAMATRIPASTRSLALSAKTTAPGLEVQFTVVGPATLGADQQTLAFTGEEGLVVITATQSGDSNFAAAAPVERSFFITLPHTSQTIDFEPPASVVYGDDPPLLRAQANSGLPCTIEVASGPAAIVDGMLVASDVGTVILRASCPGDDTYLPAAVERTVTVRPTTRYSVRVSPFYHVYSGAPLVPTFVTSPPNLQMEVRYGVEIQNPPPDIAAGSYAAAVPTNPGHYGAFVRITDSRVAPIQSNPTSYFEGWEYSLFVDFAIIPVPALTFSVPPNRLTTDGPFIPDAYTSSGRQVTFEIISGPAIVDELGRVALTGQTGTVTLRAIQPYSGEDAPAPDPVVRSFEVVAPPAPSHQTIAFAALADLPAGTPPFALEASADSGLPVAFAVVSGPATLGADGKTLTLTGPAGDVTIRATQAGGVAGGVTYLAADPVERTFKVLTGTPTQSQTIIFAQPPALTYGAAPCALVATASSGLPVDFELVSAAPAGIAVLDDNVLTVLGAGKVVVRAARPAAFPFKAAASVTRTITINKAVLTVNIADATRSVGKPNPSFDLSYEGFVGSDWLPELVSPPVAVTKAVLSSPPGQYAVTLKGGSDPNYTFRLGRAGALSVVGFGGSYEALLTVSDTLPVGKLELTVLNNSLNFTGKLTLAAEASPIAVRGTLVPAEDLASAAGSFDRVSGSLPALGLDFTLGRDGSLSGGLMRGENPAAALKQGRILFGPSVLEPTRGVGAYTLVLSPPLPEEGAVEPLPAGAGYATATINSQGVLALSGKLGDGALLTASLKPSLETPDDGNVVYRLFVNPYNKRPLSYVGGVLVPEPHVDPTRFPGRLWLRNDGYATLFWEKGPSPAKSPDASYPLGFGPGRTTVSMDPWLPPAAKSATVNGATIPAGTLAQRLLLAGDPLVSASLAVAYGPEGFDFGAKSGNLPTLLSLSPKGAFTVAAPVTVPANQTKFSLAVAPATGLLTGSFTLTDQVAPAPAKPVTRKVSFFGVLRQSPSGETVGHAGYLIDPVPGDASKEQVAGELILSASPSAK